MHTGPAASVSSVNVPPPGPSAGLTQNSGKSAPGQGTTPSKFQDVYQNLRGTQNGDAGDQPAAKTLPARKKIASDDAASTASASTPVSNSAPQSLQAAILTLSASFGPMANSNVAPPQDNPSQSAGPDEADTALPPGGSATNNGLIAATTVVTSVQPQLPAGVPSAGQDLSATATALPSGLVAAVSVPTPRPTQSMPMVSSHNLESPNDAVQATDLVVAPKQPAIPSIRILETLATTPAASSIPQTPVPSAVTLPSGESSDDTDASGNSSIPDAIPARPLPMTADNLAFSLQLSKSAEASTISPAVSTPADQLANTAQPIESAVAPFPSVLPTASTAVPSRAMPTVTTTPNESGNSSPQDSAPRQQQDFSKAGSPQRDTTDSAKPETTARTQAATQSTEDSAAAETLNDSSKTVRLAQPAIASWPSATVQSDTRPAMNISDQPGPIRANTLAAIQDIQPLAADAPRTGTPTEIVLQVDNGQTSAAVRVVDRAGSVNVSVHASDQDLRTSLRANLNDLNTQLNSQGVKTEALKTASSQGSSENRSDQGGHEQRSSGQQHSASQGDRQSPRERRASPRWLAELQEQTSANTANPGGNNS